MKRLPESRSSSVNTVPVADEDGLEDPDTCDVNRQRLLLTPFRHSPGPGPVPPGGPGNPGSSRILILQDDAPTLSSSGPAASSSAATARWMHAPAAPGRRARSSAPTARLPAVLPAGPRRRPARRPGTPNGDPARTAATLDRAHPLPGALLSSEPIPRPRAPGDPPITCRPKSKRSWLVVEVLQQVVGGQLDRLVAPLGGAVLAGDQPHAVHAAEVAVDERVPRLGLVVGAVGEPEVPLGVLVPGVGLEERVLVVGARLDVAPVAVEHVLAGVDELLGAPRRAR